MATQGVVIVVVLVLVVKIQIFEVTGASTHLLNGEAVGHLLVPGRRGVDGHGGVATTVAAQAIIYVGSPIS